MLGVVWFIVSVGCVIEMVCVCVTLAPIGRFMRVRVSEFFVVFGVIFMISVLYNIWVDILIWLHFIWSSC